MTVRKIRFERSLVVKSNVLTPTLAALTLNELRFLVFCISKLNRDSPTFSTIQCRSSDLADTFDISVDRVYSLIKDLMIRINQRPIELSDGNICSLVWWFITLEHHISEGLFTFEFHPKLKPYLLQLRENFTAYRIKDVYQFDAASTWHVYEVLRQYKNMKVKEFDLEDFKALIGVSDKYDRISNFRHKLLDPALAEINAKSDIMVEYDALKRGSRVASLRFVITDNTSNLTPGDRARKIISRLRTPNPCPKLAALLSGEYGVSTRNAYRLCLIVGGGKAAQKRIRDRLPGLKALYDALDNPRTSLGGYVYSTLCNELSRDYLVPSPD